ncbi:MAG: tripartite tricarboxylate transporter TctB family protein [Alphaproteobacteria bacterium]
MPADSARPRGEALFAALMLAGSLFLFWQAYRIAGLSSLSSAGAFPLAATGAMVAAASVTLVRALRRRVPEAAAGPHRDRVLPATVAVLMVLVALYGALLGSLGFIVASSAFLTAAVLLLHRRGPWPAIAWSAISVAAVYVVFRLIFRIVLPEGVVPERRIIALVGDTLAAWFGR